jgi:hypothetical protein
MDYLWIRVPHGCSAGHYGRLLAGGTVRHEYDHTRRVSPPALLSQMQELDAAVASHPWRHTVRVVVAVALRALRELRVAMSERPPLLAHWRGFVLEKRAGGAWVRLIDQLHTMPDEEADVRRKSFTAEDWDALHEGDSIEWRIWQGGSALCRVEQQPITAEDLAAAEAWAVKIGRWLKSVPEGTYHVAGPRRFVHLCDHCLLRLVSGGVTEAEREAAQRGLQL